ncbi:MAG: right-handed parallel beta-helix repeat-containing protein [Candidatus Eisenbacteria bacterium]|nr:right-handed parallel beta-helix repeat-containing protein [Candidatus Eisenbacteria bacterium]
MIHARGRRLLPAIVALLTVGLGFQPPARGAVLRVALDGSEDFTSVAAAALAAASGDSIFVGPGRYADTHVQVPAGVSLSIIGNGDAGSVVLARGLHCRGNGAGRVLLESITVDGGAPNIGLLSLSRLAKAALYNVVCSGGGTCPLIISCDSVMVESCRFVNNNNVWGTNGGGLSVSSCREVSIQRSLFANNRTIAGGKPDVYGDGGGGLWLNVSAGGAASVSGCTFVGNEAPNGSAVTIVGAAEVFQNTIVRNRGGVGALYVVTGGADVYANVMADNDGYGLLEDGSFRGVTCRCNAFWGNRGWPDGLYGHRDQWWGTCGQQPDGSAEEIWDDPKFCDLDGGRYGVTTTSPLLPENRGRDIGSCTEIVGAYGAECEDNPPAVTPMTWGRVKARYGAAGSGR